MPMPRLHAHAIRGSADLPLAIAFGFLLYVTMTTFATALMLGKPDAGWLRETIAGALFLNALGCFPSMVYFTQRVAELIRENSRLSLLAATDGLTSCLNRTAFIGTVSGRLRTAATDYRTMNGGALLVIDVDHFKSINDSHGHHLGDLTLSRIAEAVRGAVRGGDIVGRLGGEEFGVFLPGANPAAARAVAERLRRMVEAMAEEAGLPFAVTVSVGGVSFERHARFEELFRSADERLYEAKRAGRNRIAMSLYASC
ncbi:GGDEF domain-containing protein [Pelagibacterium montanilacus]|uniref:GGDEF domain-containing protein n=1 Tax=Pelagibacterium montanilacus TaxID=2185280 RepID=UPI0013DF0E35|nr:GGDEF domain-containing protein [Pelagibacterium montanilacus]